MSFPTVVRSTEATIRDDGRPRHTQNHVYTCIYVILYIFIYLYIYICIGLCIYLYVHVYVYVRSFPTVVRSTAPTRKDAGRPRRILK